MPTYLLRGLPAGLVGRAKARARADATTLDTVLVRYLQTYAAHGSPQAAGAKALHASRSAEERSTAARRAVTARWARHRSSP